MPRIDYSRIPYKEKRSTGEKIEKNAFYMAGDEDYDPTELSRLLNCLGIDVNVEADDKKGQVEKESNK